MRSLRGSMFAVGLVACSAVVPEVGPLRETDAGAGDAASLDGAAASSDAGVPPDSDAPRTWDVTVGADGARRFSPSNLAIRVGDTVRWTFLSDGHTVTSGQGSADGSFCSPNDTGCGGAPTSSRGDVYEHRFTAPGTYPYFCRTHREMQGTIAVQ